MASPSAIAVGSSQDIIEQVVLCVDYGNFPPGEHLAPLLTVSKLWFEITANVLWGKYAEWKELEGLLNLRDIGDNFQNAEHLLHEEMTMKDFERWNRYSKYIKNLEFDYLSLDDSQTFSNDSFILPFLELGGFSNNEPLLPRLKSLLLWPEWSHKRGARLVMAQLIPPSLVKLGLCFHTLIPSLVNNYVNTISLKAPELRELSLRFMPADGSPSPTNIHLHPSSIASLSQLGNLEQLGIGVRRIDLDFLDIIGDIPNLKVLDLQGSRQYGSDAESLQLNAPKTSLFMRKGKFKKLETLRFTGNPTSLSHIIDSYFCESTIALTTLEFKIPGGKATPQDFAALQKISSQLESLHLDFGWKHLNVPLSRSTLLHVSRCKALTELNIVHPEYLGAESIEIFTIFNNLRTLVLVKTSMEGREIRMFAHVSGSQGAGMRACLDISCLDVFAKALPHLESLELTLLACDTSKLIGDAYLTPFKKLHSLVLGYYSLLNYRRKNFDQHEAARYISALLHPSDAKFSCRALSSSSDIESATKILGFLKSFGKQVNNYMKIRESQSLLLQASSRVY